jgi:hypothetical protein
MFQKTFSQKVARIFEIVGYVMLLPSIISLIYPLLMLLASIASLRFELFLYCSIPFILFGIGTTLLVGYFKHSRGILDERKIIPLWGGTFFFNCLFLVPTFYFSFGWLTNVRDFQTEQFSNPFVLVYLAVFFWWFCAVFLSVVAAVSVFRNQKYL